MNLRQLTRYNPFEHTHQDEDKGRQLLEAAAQDRPYAAATILEAAGSWGWSRVDTAAALSWVFGQRLAWMDPKHGIVVFSEADEPQVDAAARELVTFTVAPNLVYTTDQLADWVHLLTGEKVANNTIYNALKRSPLFESDDRGWWRRPMADLDGTPR